MIQQLWDFQLKTREEKREAFKAGKRSVLVVSPCGSGKGTMTADDCTLAASNGRTVLVSAHRRILVEQIAKRMQDNGVRYSVLMADMPNSDWAIRDDRAEVTIASRDTLLAMIRNDADIPHSDIFIPDECHLGESFGYQLIRKAVSAIWEIGYTATPVLPDGSPLSDRVFQTMIEAAKIEDLIDQKKIVPVEVYAPVGTAKRRRKGLKITATGDPVKQWLAHANGLRTATFCANVAESKAVRDAYIEAGIPAEHIDATTPLAEREAIFARLLSRETLVLCNVFVAEIGWDFPALECVQLLTVCGSVQAFWQRIGRAMRIYDVENKERAVLLDHSAAMAEHGWPNVSPLWSLADREPLHKRQQERFGEGAPIEARPMICQGCGRGSLGMTTCPTCGQPFYKEKKKDPSMNREPLELIPDAAEFASVNRQSFQKEWTAILYQAAARGMPFSWANVVFQKKFHEWPETAGVTPTVPFNERNRLVGEAYPVYDRRRAVPA